MKELIYAGICGSLRRASRNMGLLRKAREIMPENCRLEIANLEEVPFYNEDIAKPASVEKLINLVDMADGLVLACPEYNYSMAPALKNALDWLSREPDLKPLYGKPAAIIGAGGGMGTSRAQYHLRQTCVYLNLHPVNKPEFFSNAFSPAFNGAGDVVDADLVKKLAAVLEALKQWTLALKN